MDGIGVNCLSGYQEIQSLEQEQYSPLNSLDTYEVQLKKKRKTSQILYFVSLGNVILLAVHFLFFLYPRSGYNPTDEDVNTLWTWSPALPIIQLETRTFDGAIYNHNEYRGEPSAEIDEAWRRISVGVPGLRINADELILLNKSTSLRPYHQLPEELGGGYLAMLEVSHLLHCLDALRKATWPDYYPPEPNANLTNVRIHTDHCIDILRAHIMCSADVGPVLFYDDPSQDIPLPDFSTTHQCRNFDRILQWAHDSDRSLEWDMIGLPR